jgi:hypothetical protein
MLSQNEYLETAEKEIREQWFGNHKIKSIEGEEGFQCIRWGKPGTRAYQVDYLLSGNMVFVTGDLGDAAYNLTCLATIDNIKDFNLSYFTGKLSAHEHRRWDFDADLARSEIKDFIFDWCDVSNANELNEKDRRVYRELMEATREWSLHDHFEKAVFSIYQHTSVDWFDSEKASCISGCGQRLPRSLIAYWLGLQMISERIKNNEEKEA